jgi:outer membrane protein OmpA-like peptidoglycan-associated protein
MQINNCLILTTFIDNLINKIYKMKIKKIKQITLVTMMLICFVYISKLYSHQDFEGIKYGLFYNIAAVRTSVSPQSFSDVTGFPNKNVTHMGSGNYYGLFVLYDFPNKSGKNNIDVGVRLSFLNNISQFNYDVYDASTQTSDNLHIRNVFDCFSFTPVIQTNLYNNINALFGLQLNIPITAEGIFNHNVRDVKIYPTSSIQPRIQLGFNYSFAIGKNRSFSIIPEINAIMNIGNDVAGNFKGHWKSNYFTAGIAIQYNKPNPLPEESIEKIDYEDILFIDTIKRIAKIEKQIIKEGQIKPNDTLTKFIEGRKVIQYVSKRIDTMFIPRNVVFDVKMNITAFNAEGIEIKVDEGFSISSIVEYVSYEETPLLNKIFFAKNSPSIPKRYKYRTINSTAATATKSHLKTTIEIYYDLLNIIGQRMNENQNYTLKLVGCNDNNTAEEKDNLDLSKARAENVRQYLNNNWGIDSNRMVVEARGLPENPSLKETEYLKMEENRRVEIYSNDNSLFNPVVSENKLISSDFERLQINAKVLSNEGIKRYIVIQKLNNKVIREVSVEDPDRINGTYNLTEHLPIDIKDIKDDAEMQITLVVTTNSGNTKTNHCSFPITYSDNIFTATSSQSSIDNLSQTNMDKNYLALFGLDDANISTDCLKIIDDVKKSVTDKSDIYIVGYSDINGSEAHNSRLAFRRADNIRNAINLSDIIVEHSTNIRLFDNAMPEGRFYSRAVEITVSSAKKNLKE